MRIENDVTQIHNRIHLLELEEKRAMRRIEETRSKADHILKTRQESLQYKKSLEKSRQQIIDQKMDRVR